MPYDANGIATVTRTPAATGQTIQAAQVNTPFTDIQAMLSQVLLRSGVAPMTGPLNMGGFSITNSVATTSFDLGGFSIINLAPAANDTDAVPRSQLPWEKVGSYTLTAVGALNVPNLAAYKELNISGIIDVTSSGAAVGIRTSVNNGGAFNSGATDYNNSRIQNPANTVGSSVANGSLMILGSPIDNAANLGVTFNVSMLRFNAALQCKMVGVSQYTSGGQQVVGPISAARLANAALNAIQIVVSAGTMTGSVTVRGLR